MLRRILLASIRCYRALLSPLLGDCCRFEPSCSRYATLCLQHHGTLRGSWLSLLRLLRCNPLFAGGIDVPPGVELSQARPDWERIARLTGGASAVDPTPAHPPAQRPGRVATPTSAPHREH